MKTNMTDIVFFDFNNNVLEGYSNMRNIPEVGDEVELKTGRYLIRKRRYNFQTRIIYLYVDKVLK